MVPIQTFLQHLQLSTEIMMGHMIVIDLYDDDSPPSDDDDEDQWDQPPGLLEPEELHPLQSREDHSNSSNKEDEEEEEDVDKEVKEIDIMVDEIVLPSPL